jgi:ABC-type transporter Mla MlaB component
MRVHVCDVNGLPADAAAVEALARLQLAAGRCGGAIRLANASTELLDLIAFMGLADVLRPESRRAARRPQQ